MNLLVFLLSFLSRISFFHPLIRHQPCRLFSSPDAPRIILEIPQFNESSYNATTCSRKRLFELLDGKGIWDGWKYTHSRTRSSSSIRTRL